MSRPTTRGPAGGSARQVSGIRRSAARPTGLTDVGNPWPALCAMLVGFFMILVDSTIVRSPTPAS